MTDDQTNWLPFEQGQTIGTSGSESGVISRDEIYEGGSRITLERDARAIPFAITCGIGGWLVHTRYFSNIDEALTEFEAMKKELARIYDAIPDEGSDDLEPTIANLEAFLRQFP